MILALFTKEIKKMNEIPGTIENEIGLQLDHIYLLEMPSTLYSKQ